MTSSTMEAYPYNNELQRMTRLARICKKHEDDERIVKQTTDLVGMFLHRVDFRIHPKDQVEELINLFPKSLLSKNRMGRLPIQSLVDCNGPRWTIPFIPMMAKIGNKENVGGVGKRGGLLIVEESDGSLLLQDYMVKSIGDPTTAVQLRDMNLLRKADVQKYDLLSQCFSPLHLHLTNEATVSFLADLDPDSLLPRNKNDGRCTLEGMLKDGLLWNASLENFDHEPFIFSTVRDTRNAKSYYKRRFGVALKAGMQHFPEHLGFLFFVGGGTTPFQLAVDAFGAEEAMDIIKRWIPPSVEYQYPILHYAIRRAPQLIDIIIEHYPKQLSLKDPESSLCPFLVAASSDFQGDLSCTYNLMRSNPQLVRIHQSHPEVSKNNVDSNPTYESERCKKKQKIDIHN